MKIHEYQAKQFFKDYNIPVPKGRVAETVEEALSAVSSIEPFPLVVKAQVHAGGRGKSGGIRRVNNIEELRNAASELLGKRLITPQTGTEGRLIDRILIEEVLDIGKEVYGGIAINRSKACVAVLMSPEGGMEIENIAERSLEKIFVETIDPCIGLRGFQAERICYCLELDRSYLKKASDIIMNLYNLFMEKDCSLAEINPLVTTGRGELVALDAKITFDDNALYRHPDVSVLRDYRQENPLEVEASKYNLNYIKLKGNVGCMVNGAGLAMATMDLIKYVGAEPANFLDVGGGATSRMIAEGLRILLSDEDVKVIFINIFGGILRCDILARGFVDAARTFGISQPVVVRLEGTNVEKGKAILEESGFQFMIAEDMGQAAMMVAEEIGRLHYIR
ncbi:MAG: ADP-forming succinate--CoA ligase subunit beta [Proteobacteria bacterium]|nr:ADP-forming succinate--CoA ligase subunit beta [Pseudomonadota bacterium]